MAFNAARGGGHSWGVSNDAGRAVRWLCSFGIDGCAALAALLWRDATLSPEPGRPDHDSMPWKSSSGRLCPLQTGVALSDFAGSIATSAIVLEGVARPALLLPFAASAARLTNSGFSVAWEGFASLTDGVGLELMRGRAALEVPLATEVTISTRHGESCRPPGFTRFVPDPNDWADLERMAERTYAPATEESRLLGAGTGSVGDE